MSMQLTEDLLVEDLRTYSGLTKEQAEQAARYVFENEDPEDTGVITCEDDDRWVELLEIGLDHDG